VTKRLNYGRYCLLHAGPSLGLSRSVAMLLTTPTTQWRKPKARISPNGCGHSSTKTLMNMWLQLTQMPTTSWSAPLRDLLDRSESTCCFVLLFLITARWAESSCRPCIHELAADELSKIFSFLLEGILRWLSALVVIPLLHPRHLIPKRASLSSPKRITVALTRCSAGFTLINKMKQAPMYKKTLNRENQFILTGAMIEIKTLAEIHVCQPH